MSGRKTSNVAFNRPAQERASALAALQLQQRTLTTLLHRLEGQQKKLTESSGAVLQHSGGSIADWSRDVRSATSTIATMLSTTDQLREARLSCQLLLKSGEQLLAEIAATATKVSEIQSIIIQQEMAIGAVSKELTQWLGTGVVPSLHEELNRAKELTRDGDLTAAQALLINNKQKLTSDREAARKKEQDAIHHERVDAARSVAVVVASMSQSIQDYLRRTSSGLRSTFSDTVAELETWTKETDSYLSGCQISRNSNVDEIMEELALIRIAGETHQQKLNEVFVVLAREVELGCESKMNELFAFHQTHNSLIEKWVTEDEVEQITTRLGKLKELHYQNEFGLFNAEYLLTENSLKSKVDEICSLEEAHGKRIYLVSGLVEVCQEMGFSLIEKPRLTVPQNRRSPIQIRFDTGNRGEINFAVSLDAIEVDSCMGGTHCFEEFQKLSEQLREAFGVETQFRGDESFQPRKISKGEQDEPVGGSHTAG